MTAPAHSHSLLTFARDRARAWWSQRDADQRWLTTLATLLTASGLAWVVGLLASSPARRTMTRLYAITMALEVALITMQMWRGVGSHFNNGTVLDTIVFSAMGLLIVTASVPMVVWTIGIWRWATLRADVRVAAGAGLSILVGGLLVGVFISLRSNLAGAGFVALGIPVAQALVGTRSGLQMEEVR